MIRDGQFRKAGDSDTGGCVEVAGTPVVAQPFPEFQDLLLVGCRQCRDGRERREEPLEVRHDGRDSGLLKHDLADPDAIRVAVLAPGQVAAMGGEPVEEPGAKPFGE